MTKILDAGAMINSDSIETEKDIYTTPSVMDELKDLKSSSLADVAKLQHDLDVLRPKEKYIKEVKGKAKEIGSLDHLSSTDLEVIALALEKDGEVVTDDYTMQNLAAHLDLDYEGVMRGEIKKKRRFKKKSS